MFARVPARPSVFVTMMLTTPGACAGVVAVIEVALKTLMPVAATPPKVTVAPVAKFVPVRLTPIPPAVLPEEGLTTVTVGPPYVNALAFVPVCPSGLVTTTLTAPVEALEGEFALIDVALTKVMDVPSALANLTVAPLTKFVPVTVTTVPPVVAPEVGLMLATVGAAARMYV